VKRIPQLIIVVLGLLTASVVAFAAKKDKCTTIQGGELVDGNGDPLTVGYDQWGYNYQAHMFNGYLENSPRAGDPVTSGDTLMMKWNDAWLANTSCDGDFVLDRHFGFNTYLGSGAWLTNHQSGEYELDG